MTSPQPQDWQSRIQDLKGDFDAAKQTIFDRAKSESEEPLHAVEVDYSNSATNVLLQSYQQVITWFASIPASGKLIALVGGGILSLTLIKTVFQLISSLVTLSIFGVILYLAYRFWIAPKTPDA